MWYQVVSPPNMPASRLSCEGKVHSATVNEATPSASMKAIQWTRGAATSLRPPGAIRRPSQAAPRPIPMQPTITQPVCRMLSEPSSSSESTSRATASVASPSRARAPENSGAIQRRSQ